MTWVGKYIFIFIFIFSISLVSSVTSINDTLLPLNSGNIQISPVGSGVLTSNSTYFNLSWVDFDGDEDEVNFNQISIANNSGTIVIRMKQDGSIREAFTGGAGGGADYIRIDGPNNEIEIEFSTTGTNYNLGYSGITETDWNTLILTFSPYDATDSNVTLYINGILQSSDLYTKDTLRLDTIGEGYSTGTHEQRWLNGSVDYYYVFNDTLNKSQIRELSNNNKQYIPIISYHKIGEDSPSTIHMNNLSQFIEEMQYLYDNGFTTITLNDMNLIKNKQKTAPLKPIVLVFDDSTPDHYTNVSPVLDSLGFVGVSAVIPWNIDGATHMTLSQLESLKSKGWELACHDNVDILTFGDSGDIYDRFANLTLNFSSQLGFDCNSYVPHGNSWNVTSNVEARKFFDVITQDSFNILNDDYYYNNFVQNYTEDNSTKRIGIRNSTTIDQFIKMSDIYGEVLVKFDFNEGFNNISYDSSGNSNDGTINGPLYENDGNLLIIIEGIHYSLSNNGLFNLLDDSFIFSSITLNWAYLNVGDVFDYFASAVALILELLVVVGIIAIYVIFRGIFKNSIKPASGIGLILAIVLILFAYHKLLDVIFEVIT